MTQLQAQGEKPQKKFPLGIVTACFVVVYLLTVWYGYYNGMGAVFAYRMLLWPVGAALAGIIVTQTGLMRNLDMKLMLAYAAWVIFSTFAAHQNTTDTYEQTINFVICFALVCYPMAAVLPKEKRRPMFNMVFHIFIASFFVICVIGLVVVVLQTRISTPFSNVWIGLNPGFDNRLVLLAHPNYIGGICAVVVPISIYMIMGHRHWAVKAYYGLVIFAVYVVLALTDSRTNMIAVAVGVGLLALLLVLRKVKLRAKILTAAIGVVCMVAATALCYLAYDVVLDGVYWTSSKVIAQESPLWSVASAEETTEAEAEKATINITQSRALSRDITTATGRTPMWKEAFESAKAKPIIFLWGTTNRHVDDTVPSFSSINGRLHNSFVQVFMALGVPGFLIMLAFLVFVCWQSLRLFFGIKGTFEIWDAFLPVVLLSGILTSLTESFYFLEEMGVYSPIFFVVAGYVVCLVRENDALHAPAQGEEAASEGQEAVA